MTKKLGNHTIKVVISSYQSLKQFNYTTSIKEHITSKIVRLGIDESEEHELVVKDINFNDKTVKVGSYLCGPHSIEQEQVLHVKQSAPISSYAKAYFLGFQDGRAIFNFVPTGQGFCMLTCLSGDTFVDTPDGPVNIKNLKHGMSVWTLDNLGHKKAEI